MSANLFVPVSTWDHSVRFPKDETRQRAYYRPRSGRWIFTEKFVHVARLNGYVVQRQKNGPLKIMSPKSVYIITTKADGSLKVMHVLCKKEAGTKNSRSLGQDRTNPIPVEI